MNAVVVRVRVKDREPAERMLREQVIPMVSQLPGFVAGYWTRATDGDNGLSMVVFESEEGAQAMASGLREQGTGNDAVELQDVEIREVVASA